MSTASLNSQSMPNNIVATCPACQTRYKIKVSMSGRKAKCGKCQTRMRIPTLRAKVQEAVSQTTQRARSAVSSGRSVVKSDVRRQVAATTLASTKTAGIGMLMNAWASAIMLATVGTAIGTFFTSPEALLTYQNYFLGALCVGALMGLIGLLTCGAAPSESRSRSYIMSAIFLTLLNVGITGYVVVCGYNGMELIVSQQVVNIATMSLSLLAFYCFMIFAAKIARYIGRTELSAMARGVIWFQTLIVSVCGGLIALANTEATAGNETLLRAIAVGILAAAAINQIIMIVLQFQLGSALRKN